MYNHILHPIRFTLLAIGLLGQVAVSIAQTGSWAGKAPMPKSRLGLAVCAVDGRIYAIGGYSAANSPGLQNVEEYDPATDSWASRADMPTGRRWLTATAVNGKCYAIGGHAGPFQPGLVTVEEYDPIGDNWASKAGLPTARVGHAAAAVDGKIYVIGGGTTSVNAVTTLAVYDPVADSWTTKAESPNPRGFFPAASTLKRKIYVIGGSRGPTRVEEYDPATDTWIGRADMPTGRLNLTASAVNGTIYAIGGQDQALEAPLSTVEEYDPVHDTWGAGTDLPDVRWGLASGVVDGKIYAIGGSRTVPPPHPGLSTNEEYTAAGQTDQTVRRCFFDAETLDAVLEVRVTSRNASPVLVGASGCSDEIRFDDLTIEAPGYRRRDTHAINAKKAKKRAALPGENGQHFGLFPENSAFTDLLDSGRTTGKKRQRGFLQGLPYMKFEIVRPSGFPMPASEVQRAAITELRKRAKFKKPSFSIADSVTREDQILLRHVAGEEPSVVCTILEAGVCWGPVVSFDAVASDRQSSLEEGLRRIFFHGKSLVVDAASIKLFYRGFQASVVGQRLKGGKEVDATVDPDS